MDFYTLYGRRWSFPDSAYHKVLTGPLRLSRGTYECAHHNASKLTPNRDSTGLVTPLAILRGGCCTSGSVSMLQGSKKLVSIPFINLAIDSDKLYSNIPPILWTHVDGLVRVPQQYPASHCAGFGTPSFEALINRRITCNTDSLAYIQHDQLRCGGRGTIP